jgi:tRNA (guanine-N7-)-methyltransferase
MGARAERGNPVHPDHRVYSSLVADLSRCVLRGGKKLRGMRQRRPAPMTDTLQNPTATRPVNAFAHGIAAFPAVVMPPDWTKHLPLDELFPVRQPLALDIGCGKGGFLVARAANAPQFNYLGIERQLKRVQKVSGKIVRLKLPNVRILRADASFVLEGLLPPAVVGVAFLFFPDPWPKRRHWNRRLVSGSMSDLLCRVLMPGGELHIATDHRAYFEAMRDVFAGSGAFAAIPPFVPLPDECTEFEAHYRRQNAPIHRCSFAKL